jgi:subtilisin family serine protease
VVEHQAEFGIWVVNMSFGGDPISELRGNPVDTAVADLMAGNIVVTVAAGNEGKRRLIPPGYRPRGPDYWRAG